MPLQIAPKLRRRTAQKWLVALERHMYPGEFVWALARTTAKYPPCDGLAITNARVLAFLGSDVATSGPRVVVVAGNIQRFDIMGLGFNTLVITTRDNQQVSFGVLHRKDVAFVSHFVHYLGMSGFPPEVWAAIEAQRRFAEDSAAAAQREAANRAAAMRPDVEERAATERSATDPVTRPSSGRAITQPGQPPTGQDIPEPALKPGAATRAAVNHALKLVDSLLDRGRAAQNLPQKLRDELATNVRAAIEDRTHAALRDLPASSLKDALPRGTRLGSLGASRFRTVADIAASSPAALDAVPGIGPQSAYAIYTEAMAQRTRARERIRLRLDPDRRSRIDTSLLRLLLVLRRVDPLVGEIGAPLTELRTQVDPLRGPAQRAGKRVAMFFAGEAERTRAEAAREQLQAIAADPALAELDTKITDVLAAAGGGVTRGRHTKATLPLSMPC